eukprot:29837-Eustigmatos_ZCMA.PRE.1
MIQCISLKRSADGSILIPGDDAFVRTAVLLQSCTSTCTSPSRTVKRIGARSGCQLASAGMDV